MKLENKLCIGGVSFASLALLVYQVSQLRAVFGAIALGLFSMMMMAVAICCGIQFVQSVKYAFMPEIGKPVFKTIIKYLIATYTEILLPVWEDINSDILEKRAGGSSWLKCELARIKLWIINYPPVCWYILKDVFNKFILSESFK